MRNTLCSIQLFICDRVAISVVIIVVVFVILDCLLQLTVCRTLSLLCLRIFTCTSLCIAWYMLSCSVCPSVRHTALLFWNSWT